MGFIDWINEPDAEAIGQHLDRIRVDEPAPVRTFACPYCKISFGTTHALLEHTRLRHPLSLPLLSLGGSLATSELVIRTPVDVDAIGLQNCTRIDVAKPGENFTEITESHFRSQLAEMHEGRLHVRLSNERSLDTTLASIEHRIEFRIPNPETLLEIESRFVATMQENPISVSASRAFWDACGSLTETAAAADYADALANYVIGLAIKQGQETDARQPFAKFKEKFMDAHAVLGTFDAPLAFAVCQIIQFNLNNFIGWKQAESIVPGLGMAARFFHDPGAGLSSPAVSVRSALPGTSRCPVDDLTVRIIEVTQKIMERRVKGPTLETLLPPLLRWNPLPEYDRQKLHVLMAALHIQRGSQEMAGSHLRTLRSDPNFGSWATNCLGI